MLVRDVALVEGRWPWQLLISEHVRVPRGVVSGIVGHVGSEVHEEWCPASRLPYEVLGGLGVQVGFLDIRAVIGDYLAILVDVVFGIGVPVFSFPTVPLIPAWRHV